MKPTVVVLAFVLLAPSHLRAQLVDETLRKAKAMYIAGNTEGATAAFAGVLTAKTVVTTAQKVEAYKYLGASWVAKNKPDSATSYFVAALEYDPFATLDAADFVADDRAAFDRARKSVFRIGVQPITAQAIDVASTDSLLPKVYRFKLVATHSASFAIELANVRDTTQGRHSFPAMSLDGARDLDWTGSINSIRADSGLYELRITATDRLNPANPPIREKVVFRLEHVYAPLEQAIPPFADLKTGVSDTLTSRLSNMVPVQDGLKGMFLAGFAAGLPYIALSEKAKMSGWKSHFGTGIALGLGSGLIGAWWGYTHRDNAAAVKENARRVKARADYNAGVLARNTARLGRTILIIRPVA